MSKQLSIKLPDALYTELRRHAQSRGLRPTQAARDLIRRGLGVVRGEYDAGFHEGLIAGKAEVLKKIAG